MQRPRLIPLFALPLALSVALSACGALEVPLTVQSETKSLTLQSGDSAALLLTAQQDGREVPVRLSASASCVTVRTEGQAVFVTAPVVTQSTACVLNVEGRNLNAVARWPVPVTVLPAPAPDPDPAPEPAPGPALVTVTPGTLSVQRGGETLRAVFTSPRVSERWEVGGAGGLEVTLEDDAAGSEGALLIRATNDTTLGVYDVRLRGYTGNTLVAEGALRVTVNPAPAAIR